MDRVWLEDREIGELFAEDDGEPVTCIWGWPVEEGLVGNPPWRLVEGAEPCQEPAVRGLGHVGIDESLDDDEFVRCAVLLCDGHADWLAPVLQVGRSGQGERNRRKVASIQRSWDRVMPPPLVRRRIRVDAGLSQVELGECVGVNGSTISNWESARNEPQEPDRTAYLDELMRLKRSHQG